MKTTTPPMIRLKSYRPPAFLIETVDLAFDLGPTKTTVRSRLKMRRNPEADKASGPLVLDGENLTLEKIVLDGKDLAARDYKTSESALTIRVVPNDRFTLEIVNTIDPSANTALQGLYLSKGIYCTQCEAQGFRRITYFLDRPDVLATYRVRIEADRNDVPVLLSNGNPVERGTTDGGRRHYAIWKDPHPKPCYLFALVGGNLGSIASNFKTMSGREVALSVYVEPGREARCGWAMEALKRSMTWDEQKFGREYDLDVFNIVAVSDFNMGAMENKGLNVFNDALVLASPETATDNDYFNIERVIAHEYFHNWTGNRITCRDWFQLCLKEGLTVYRDQEYSADQGGSRAVQRIRDVRSLKAGQFAEDAGPLAHPVRPDHYMEINNFYTNTVYNKGAELVRMIATLLGPQTFRAGMDRYFKLHDGQAATVEDFVACFEAVSKRDLTQFMLWYSQAGTPKLACTFKYDPKKQSATLDIEQILPETPDKSKKKPVHLPLALGLIGPDGHDLPLVLASGEKLTGGIVEITARRHSFTFTGVATRPVPSLLRAFSAPVLLDLDVSDEDLVFRIANDSDDFNRWQAMQDYAMRLLLSIVATMHADKTPPAPKAFIAALGKAIADETLSPAIRAQIMALPGDAVIARAIGHDIDPDMIHKARRWLRRKLALGLGDTLDDLWRRHRVKGTYEPSPEQTGTRALRGSVLGLLTERGTAEDIMRTAEFFAKARNATDELIGFALLTEVRGPERKAAIDRFYARWKDDHLVIDTWFVMQAYSTRSTALSDVKRLMRHPLFSIKNPNKVRALIGAFTSNTVQFNRPDGAGYAFLGQQILVLDAINPQVAARMLGAFRDWRLLEAGRRKLAKAELEAIAKSKALSRDARDIVTRMLA